MGATSVTSFPDTLAIELTSECNERCKHCYIPSKIKQRHSTITYEKLCAVIDEFAEAGGKSVLFTGGEILIYKKLLDIIEHAHKKGLWIALFFNGIALKEEHIVKFKEVGVNDIQISLYSVNTEIHDSITKVKGSCERTKKTIERLVDSGLPVRIACSVLKDNKSALCDLLDYTTSLNIHLGLDFNIIPLEDKTSSNLNFRLSPEEIESCLIALAKHNPDFTKKFLLRLNRANEDDESYENFLDGSVCGAARDMLYITADGELALCPGWTIDGGNLSTGLSLKEFWKDNELLNEVRSKKERSFPKCIKCEALNYCVRCYARNYLETGSYSTPPEFACQYAFIAKKVAESEKLV